MGEPKLKANHTSIKVHEEVYRSDYITLLVERFEPPMIVLGSHV